LPLATFLVVDIVDALAEVAELFAQRIEDIAHLTLVLLGELPALRVEQFARQRLETISELLAKLLEQTLALIGGLLLQWLLGFNFSVAVAVGYIALFGIAVETAVVMVVYLHTALDERLAQGRTLNHEDIEAATTDGAVLRLRPVLMTVFAVIGSLGPILWETGISSDVMKPIAAPIVGGMVSSTLAVMVLVPILFTMLKERQLRQGTLKLRNPRTP